MNEQEKDKKIQQQQQQQEEEEGRRPAIDIEQKLDGCYYDDAETGRSAANESRDDAEGTLGAAPPKTDLSRQENVRNLGPGAFSVTPTGNASAADDEDEDDDERERSEVTTTSRTTNDNGPVIEAELVVSSPQDKDVELANVSRPLPIMVEARPILSLKERLQKVHRKHRRAVYLACLLLLLVVAAIVTTAVVLSNKDKSNNRKSSGPSSLEQESSAESHGSNTHSLMADAPEDEHEVKGEDEDEEESDR
jgi:hypothetical protein